MNTYLQIVEQYVVQYPTPAFLEWLAPPRNLRAPSQCHIIILYLTESSLSSGQAYDNLVLLSSSELVKSVFHRLDIDIE